MDSSELEACDVDRSRTFLHGSFVPHIRVIDALDSGLRPIVRRESKELFPYRYNEDLHLATTPASQASIPEAGGFIAADRARRRPRRIGHLTRAEFPGSDNELHPRCWTAHSASYGGFCTSFPHSSIQNSNQGVFDTKFIFPCFDGESYDEDYLDWEKYIDDFFYYVGVPLERQVRFIVGKLTGRAIVWWTHMIRARQLEGRRDVKTWRKMKRLLREQFLSSEYEILLERQPQECLQEFRSVKVFTKSEISQLRRQRGNHTWSSEVFGSFSCEIKPSEVLQMNEKKNGSLEAATIQPSTEINEARLELVQTQSDENAIVGIEIENDNEGVKPGVEIPPVLDDIPLLAKVSYYKEEASELDEVVKDEVTLEGNYIVVVSEVAEVSLEGKNIMECDDLVDKETIVNAEVIKKNAIDIITESTKAKVSSNQVKSPTTTKNENEFMEMTSRKLNIAREAIVAFVEGDKISASEEKSESLIVEEATYSYHVKKKLEFEATSYEDELRIPCEVALKKMEALAKKAECLRNAPILEAERNKFRFFKCPGQHTDGIIGISSEDNDGAWLKGKVDTKSKLVQEATSQKVLVSEEIQQVRCFSEEIISNDEKSAPVGAVNFVPLELGKMQELSSLLLLENSTIRDTPTEVSNCLELVVLNLSTNTLYGELPTVLGRLVAIEKLHLADNVSNGSIPIEILNCKSLTVFQFARNGFSCSVPEEIVYLKSAQTLFCWDNSTSSTIPQSFCKCFELYMLNLLKNKLTGRVLEEVFNLNQLNNLCVGVDPISRSIFGLEGDGVIASHDEEIRRFFKHSSIKVMRCPHSAGERHSWLRQ